MEGRPPISVARDPVVEHRTTSPDYFRAMQIPPVIGRFLNDGDKAGKVVPILINETLARFYWPHSSPLGVYITSQFWANERAQIVGVVGDVHNQYLGRPPAPELYYNYQEHPPFNLAIAVRSQLAANVVAAQLRRAVASVDPSQPAFEIQSSRISCAVRYPGPGLSPSWHPSLQPVRYFSARLESLGSSPIQCANAPAK